MYGWASSILISTPACCCWIGLLDRCYAVANCHVLQNPFVDVYKFCMEWSCRRFISLCNCLDMIMQLFVSSAIFLGLSFLLSMYICMEFFVCWFYSMDLCIEKNLKTFDNNYLKILRLQMICFSYSCTIIRFLLIYN